MGKGCQHETGGKGTGPQKLMTTIISLIRFAAGESNVLEPFSKTAEDRFDGWLAEPEKLGRTFAPEQMEWLIMVKDHIASSVSISMEYFENVPFNQKGGAIKAYQLFGAGLDDILREFNGVMVA